jgi:RimJ/RimL family protein N-acetyltransferase
VLFRSNLLVRLEAPPVRLEPFADTHIEGLRQACAQDDAIWDIYPVSLDPDRFDATLADLRTRANRQIFAVLNGSEVVGMTSYIDGDDRARTVEIGGTYIAPSVRGGPFNRTMKALMIDHAFAQGFGPIGFRVDTRNTRSMRAVEKLGAVRTGTLLRNMTTWTGYVRDTAVFALTREAWSEACNKPSANAAQHFPG